MMVTKIKAEHVYYFLLVVSNRNIASRKVMIPSKDFQKAGKISLIFDYFSTGSFSSVPFRAAENDMTNHRFNYSKVNLEAANRSSLEHHIHSFVSIEFYQIS